MQKSTLVLFAAFFVAFFTISPARADTTYSISPSTIFANAGDVGDSFDVVFTNNGPSSLTVAAFAFEISVSSPDVTMTGADFNTGAIPYILPLSDSFDAQLPTPINIDSGQVLDGSDVVWNPFTSVTVDSGQSVALADVLFNVANDAAPGPVSITFTGVPSGGIVADSNNLADANANLITVDNYSAGTIMISSATAVPEPSAAVFLGAIVLIAALSRKIFARV